MILDFLLLFKLKKTIGIKKIIGNQYHINAFEHIIINVPKTKEGRNENNSLKFSTCKVLKTNRITIRNRVVKFKLE